MDALPAAEPVPAPSYEPGEPFTPAMAARAGLGRAALERAVRGGRVVRLVRGVYVDAAVTLTPLLRGRALSLVVGRRHVVVDRTAAWVHGAPGLRPAPEDPLPLDLLSRRRYLGPAVPMRSGDVVLVGGVRCTSALRTALDVARHLPPERALPLLDGLLGSSAVAHADVVAALEQSPTLPGIDQARELVAIADGRACGAAESVLRLHWLGATLPTPTTGWRVEGVRIALALPLHRFGVVLSRDLTLGTAERVAAAGWHVIAVDERRVLAGDARSAGGHLVREFHRHLLGQVP